MFVPKVLLRPFYFLLPAAFLVAPGGAFAREPVKVCVQVKLVSARQDRQKPLAKKLLKKDKKSIVSQDLPSGLDPVAYLKRLLEYFVTHEKGFSAVQEGCDQHLDVELYPLEKGWTAFARYSGHSREERVDRLYSSELVAFAERAVVALLYDKPISTTIKRDNVLTADSIKSRRTVKGSHHFVFDIGSRPRGGILPTSVFRKDEDKYRIKNSTKLFWPMHMSMGYLAKFEAWGIETLGTISIGTYKLSADKTPQKGGHVDYGGDAGLSLHMLYYFDPRGLTSAFIGAGSTFELIWFSSVKPYTKRDPDPRTTIFAGGLTADLIAGYEFMRANAAQFRLVAGVHLPTYIAQCEDKYGASVNTWFPAVSLGLGVIF
ncbi:MAG: hypothetical protein GXP49_08630 [Deltaproteobacteria bacterium]|nr:hypothetical protein [Deltaproteobacteria bacterium]